MLQIGFATLYTEPRKISDMGNISPLWLGDAITQVGERRLFIKEVTYQELVAECLCTTLGSVIGLPVIQTYVVRDPYHLLKAKFLVGSDDAEIPSFNRHWSMADKAQQGFLINALYNWNKLNETAVFDEWIANPDRNTGNFLWDGGDEWHLIDHGRALWATNPNAPATAPFDNILAAIINGISQEIGIADLKRTLKREEPKYQAIQPANIIAAAKCTEIGCVSDAQNKLISLISRINALPNLLSRHGKQQELF